ncbi:hypothetical protein WDJ50_02550 [Deinococcus sp. VB142]|uniref:Uncharacterized protein n=1 Tax=Deinococcus sp. VB142 TaxID=3112952 RepID=A0AAU6Q314_9DEIO
MPAFVWRDDWDGPPNVLVISETAITERGVVEDALLFVLDETPGCVALTERGGSPLTFILPQDALGGTFMRVGIDLSTQQENPQ